jgi:hypothetical protein
METKRLIPYSVHLREDIYLKLKGIAKDRKATSLVRDAITMIIEGDDAFNGGYKKAVRDVISLVQFDEWAGTIGIGGQSIADKLVSKIERLEP